jgi:hypothetical protein
MSNQSDRWIATARLLRCTGFGTTGRTVDALVEQDVSAYLDRVLSADPDADPGARATPMPPLVSVPAYPAAGAPRAAFRQLGLCLLASSSIKCPPSRMHNRRRSF